MALNQFLYDQLKAIDPRIQTSGDGEAFLGAYHFDAGTNKHRLRVTTSGEYYHIRCPFCAERNNTDLHGKLWINHRWGVPDDRGFCNWWLAICYKSNCLADPGTLRRLRNKVYGLGKKSPPLPPEDQDAASWAVMQPKTLPGDCVSLSALGFDHPANQYLRSRDFSPAQLESLWGVRYCAAAPRDMPLCQDRIVIPIVQDGTLVGWQARPFGVTPKYIPKYYTCPNFPKRAALYNWDIARMSPFVVVTEGVTDAWRVGPCAVSLFGKTASTRQVEMLASNWRNGVVVVLIDPDAQEYAVALALRLASAVKQVVQVALPIGTDPGSFSEGPLWELIYGAMVSAHVDPAILVAR